MRDKCGFTLVELLIVVAILGVLAAVVIPSVLGLIGRGGKQAYETDAEVIQLTVAAFYSDVHSGWNDLNDDDPTYTDNTWGANATDEDAGHYYPTAIAVVSGHVLELHDTTVDPDYVNNPLITNGTTAATDTDIADHAIWMGLLVEAPGDEVDAGATGRTARGIVSVLLGEMGPYLQELPNSADDEWNGAPAPGGGYCWVVGRNGTVYGAYSKDGGDNWYAGFSGTYP